VEEGVDGGDGDDDFVDVEDAGVGEETKFL